MSSIDYSVKAWAEITNAPGSAGVSFVVSTGKGARFANGAQERLMRAYQVSDPGIQEIVYCTNRSTDTFTVTRNKNGAGAQNIPATGWALEDIEDLGPMHVPAYDSGYYGATGGGTWTPASGDVLRQAWHRTGYKLEYEVVVQAATITGTVTTLKVFWPTATGITALARGGAFPCVVLDAGAIVAGYMFWIAGDNFVSISKATGANFTAGAASAGCGFQAFIEYL